ncbi:hypothetical protein M569_12790, partial [Genlisea aurea]
AAVPKPLSAFTVTPHKLSFCILVQVYAPPSQISIPFPFSSVSQHNRFGILLLSLTKECDAILEPSLDELIAKLSEVSGELNEWFSDHLTQRLTSFSSPDDLFNFFADLRVILGGSESTVMDDDQILLDPSSTIGLYVRRCLLAFNQMSFEAISHLLTNIGMYCKVAFSGYPLYELSQQDVSANYSRSSLHFENIGMGTCDYDKVGDDFESDTAFSSNDTVKGIGISNGTFLCTNSQIQGYLSRKAEDIEKCKSSFTLNAFDFTLTKLKQLAPELHRVHYLCYLNNLYHDDYSGALENLHRYFDYSFGRYEIALLCLGMMHFRLGHPKQALEVLTEAVRVSQQYSDDTCLAYTLVAISNLLSELAFPKTSGVIGSSHGHVADIGASLSVQQELYFLIRRSLNRSESLKLKRLVASIHLEMAKYDLTHIQRPLLSFGPKASLKLKTNPLDVYKAMRLSSHVISDFSDENCVMEPDGAFCTAWMKGLETSVGSVIFPLGDDIRSNSNTIRFSAQSIAIPGSVLQLSGSSCLRRVASWEMYGSVNLAQTSAIIFAACFADSASLCDVELAYSKLIQHLAVYRGYRDAFIALRIAEEKFSCALKSKVMLIKLQLMHDYALHRWGHLKLAQQFCDELTVLASSSISGVDMELKTEATLRHSRTLLAAKQYIQAAAVADSLFSTCFKFNMQVKNASVLLLLAEIHLKSGNPVVGIPYALASLSYCQSFNLDLLKASAMLILSELWLSFGSNHAKRALSLLHDSFPMLLGQGGLELRSRAFITEAKCYLADPDFSVSDDSETVLEPLRQASLGLELLQYHEMASEAFYLLAIVYDKVGKVDEREEAATGFRNHIAALRNP